VQVSQICLGTMMFGQKTGKPESIRIIDHTLSNGVNFIDTANVYAANESERILGEALAAEGKRQSVILATKFHFPQGKDVNARGLSRRHLIDACHASLKRLRTDWIDLYQLHRSSADVPIDETLRALDDLIRAGKVRYIGSSTFPPSRIVEAQWVAERRGRERFRCEQPPYSMLIRAVETDVLPTCQRYGMGVIPWSPLAGGWLTGRYRKGQELPETHRAQRIPQRYDMSLPGNQAKLEAADALAQLAEEAGLTLIDLALAFVLRHPAVTAPIIGPRTMEQLTSQLGAVDVELSDDVLDRIDEIVPPGTDVGALDQAYQPQALEDLSLRRRPLAARAAA
jgi:aryl-alcohol dehydrogenase-like predicted oxidoreductase